MIKKKKKFKKSDEKIFNHIIKLNQHEMTLLFSLIVNIKNDDI